MKIALVSCVKTKQPVPAPAGELYTSNLFRSLRAYARRQADCWYVLSAEHGLLAPETVIAPYERTLNRMPIADRRAWADRVCHSLSEAIPSDASILMLAGERYRENLMPWLAARGHTVEVPLAGKRLGHQLSWLRDQVGRSV
ncbi:DUF6884 domain-containing protein [Salinicola halophyticus]|uniref:DUF6884 domain-containing protein n=1 Tax=Salinicola halophyticus TaxID=1808881 RepID=UPI003F448515